MPASTPTGAPEAANAAADGVSAFGFLQVDAVTFQQSSVDQLDPGSGAPLNQDRLVISSARVALLARHGLVSANCMLDANTVKGFSVGLFTAEGTVRDPWKGPPVAEVGAGLFLIPFGYETSELANRRLFLEPSTWVSALFPGMRDLGARVSGEWAFVRYDFAVMNGNPVGGASLPGWDPNRAKDFLGRVRVHGEIAPRVELELGASGLFGTGFHPGVRPTKDSIVFRDANGDGTVQSTEIQLVAGSPGEPSQNFSDFALGAQFALATQLPVLGAARLYGELAWAQNLDRGLFVADPVVQGRNLRELGFMLGLRQELTRHAEWGVRYDYYDPDQDATDQQALRLVSKNASFETWGVALAWCSLPFARLTVEYDHRHNPLGKTRSGKPTTLAMDALTIRGQVEF